MSRGRPSAVLGTSDTSTPVVSAAAVLAFGRRWSAFGGGPAEDIMVEFGWTSDRFFAELERLLSAHPPADIPAPVVASMIEVCRRRLWMGQ